MRAGKLSSIACVCRTSAPNARDADASDRYTSSFSRASRSSSCHSRTRLSSLSCSPDTGLCAASIRSCSMGSVIAPHPGTLRVRGRVRRRSHDATFPASPGLRPRSTERSVICGSGRLKLRVLAPCRRRSAARHHEALVLAPALVQLLDLVRRRVAREVPQAGAADVPDPVRAAGGEVHGRVGTEDLRLAAGGHLAAALDDEVHRLDRAVLVDRRAAARADVDEGDHELPRADRARADQLVGEALVPLQGLGGLAVDDLHGPNAAATEAGHLEFRMGRTAQMLKGLRRVRGAMVRVQVIAYTPTDVIEEADVTVGRCRELLEKYAVTWVNVVDPDTRTLEELETLFGFPPLTMEDARNQDLAPKIDVYEDLVFVVARTIVWAEDIDTNQLSLFLGKKFVVTIHDKVLPQLEDVRIGLRKKNPRMLKAGADFLGYTILDVLVDSYFPHLDRFQSLLDQLGDEIVRRPSGEGITRLHELRTDIVRLRNALRPQRDLFGVLSRLEIPIFRKETRNYLRDVQDHMISALDTLDANREIAASLMEVQATLVSNEVNEVIKVLTVLFTVTLPIAIVSSAFGMNVAFFGFNQPEGLYLALALMIAPTLALVVWMRRKGWLGRPHAAQK